ncbi:MAG: (2Fe-2S)-binding protein [Acidobacteriota bacterium]|nr:(2Fe-2S)-binding protein [Acidobacteriota bacterium]MDQ5872527.1 (2Fe-2S)-binding protein [Acidobacteriota bacterium]
MPTVVFVNEGRAGVVEEGSTVLQAALDLGVNISHICGGNGICSTCRVEVVAGGENLTPVNPQEIAYDLGDRRRLGCQARVKGNVAVRVLMVPKADLY